MRGHARRTVPKLGLGAVALGAWKGRALAAQVNRRPEYNGGTDLQKPPYAILRIRIDAGPA